MSLAGTRLLLVEDNPGDVRLFREMLATLGYPHQQLIVAGSVSEATQLLAAGGIDAVLLDLGLPDEQGQATLERILRSGHDLPIIVLTGLSDQEVGAKSIENGAQDYLIKGEVRPDLLERAIRYALGRHNAQLSARDLSARAAAAEARLQATEEGKAQLEQEVAVRKNAQADLERTLARLRALRNIDRSIIANSEVGPMLNAALDESLTQLDADGAAVLLHDGSAYLRTADFRGLPPEFSADGPVPVDDPMIAAALHDGSAYSIIEDRLLSSVQGITRFARLRPMQVSGMRSYHLVALAARGVPLGVMEFYRRQATYPSTDWLSFAETLAGQTAMAIDSSAMQQRLRQANLELVSAYDATIEGWSRALDLRDKETEGHSRRVTELSLRLAAEVGMASEDLDHLKRGALLHDIGKMGVPDSILYKAGPLDESEWGSMRRHTTLARDLLAPIRFLHRALEVPFCHHERWDGSGYPRGLAGTAIPLSARIFAVADVFDALTSDRPYRPAWPPARASEFIRDQAGSHFDPHVVEAFMRLQTNQRWPV